MKITEYGLKLHYRSPYNNYEEVSNLESYLDKPAKDFPYSQDCTLLLHGSNIGYISYQAGLTVALGSTKYYFNDEKCQSVPLRERLIYVSKKASGFESKEELLQLIEIRE